MLQTFPGSKKSRMKNACFDLLGGVKSNSMGNGKTSGLGCGNVKTKARKRYQVSQD